MVEHPAVNRRVVGSSPTRGATSYDLRSAASLVPSIARWDEERPEGRRHRRDGPVPHRTGPRRHPRRPPAQGDRRGLVRLVAPRAPTTASRSASPASSARAGPHRGQPRQRELERLRSGGRARECLKPCASPMTPTSRAWRSSGKGVEMVVTLGTGFGTGLFLDGRLGGTWSCRTIPSARARRTRTARQRRPQARRQAVERRGRRRSATSGR